MKFPSRLKALLGVVIALAVTAASAAGVRAQAGFPDALRRYSDTGAVPFRIGTAVTLQGGPSRYPVNGYQPGLLTRSPQDRAYRALVRGQFNQIEGGNETKMMSLWTGGATRVNSHYVARTNLFDPDGPLARLCGWGEAQRPRLTVRGHCMVYYQDYTLPAFPASQAPLFVRGAGGRRVLNSPYTPEDLRDMLRSYVRQVVDATLAQNAAARARHGARVIEMWDVTNEVVSEDAGAAVLPALGFAYRGDDPWYNNGPKSAGAGGYDYANDIYRWAAQEMTKDIGTAIGGRRIAAADRFSLYYNDYNLEGNQDKLARALAMIRHIRRGGGVVNGLGFQAHVSASGLDAAQFDRNVGAAVGAGLRFSVTEADCAIQETPRPGGASVAEQEANQGKEYAEITAICVRHERSCDLFQVWGATDDGSWIQNAEATPITRWVKDARPGATSGQTGYWPKEGQPDPVTLCDPATGALDPNSGHAVSDAYDRILAALKAR